MTQFTQNVINCNKLSFILFSFFFQTVASFLFLKVVQRRAWVAVGSSTMTSLRVTVESVGGKYENRSTLMEVMGKNGVFDWRCRSNDTDVAYGRT